MTPLGGVTFPKLHNIFIKKCSSKILIIEILNYNLLHCFPLACSAVYVGGFSVFVSSLSLSVCVWFVILCVDTWVCDDKPLWHPSLSLRSLTSLPCGIACCIQTCHHSNTIISSCSTATAYRCVRVCVRVCGCVNVSDVRYEHFSLDHTPFSLQELQCIISKFLHVRHCRLFHDVILVKIFWEH